MSSQATTNKSSVAEQVSKAIEEKALHIQFLQEIRERNYKKALALANQIILKEPNNQKIKEFIQFLSEKGDELKQMEDEEAEELKEQREEELENASDYDSNDDSDEEDDEEQPQQKPQNFQQAPPPKNENAGKPIKGAGSLAASKQVPLQKPSTTNLKSGSNLKK